MNSLYDVFIMKNDRHLPPVNPVNSLINNFNNDNELHTERERERGVQELTKSFICFN